MRLTILAARGGLDAEQVMVADTEDGALAPVMMADGIARIWTEMVEAMDDKRPLILSVSLDIHSKAGRPKRVRVPLEFTAEI